MRRISPQLLAAAPPFLARQASNPLALRRRLRNKVQLRELSGLPRPQWKRHALRHTPQSLAPVRSHSHVSTTATTAAAATTTRQPQSPLLLHGRSRGSILAPGILSRADSAVLYSSSSSSSSSSTPSGDGTPTRSAILACPEFDPSTLPKLPFRFETGVALFAKRAPRPFPPPFLSPPSGSFSDPLSTHHHGPDKRATFVDGRLIQGVTNGDDAVFASDYFVCANDGVGAWSTRPRGHAGLWARLIVHFWAAALFEEAVKHGTAAYTPDPVGCLQRAYDQTIAATQAPNDWQGTTTATGALLHYETGGGGADGETTTTAPQPVLYATNIGDSQIMVIRPSQRQLVYKSTEQWHWFDCPRQLGTNSPDTPADNAVLDVVPLREGDVVLAMSDGVIDNLWAHEIVDNVSESVERWGSGFVKGRGDPAEGSAGMAFVAEELMEAAKNVATDPFAESPFMEHAIEEGLASEGGKMDDISVVAAVCRRND